MCTIRDFCRTGMLLSSEAGQPTLGQGASGPQREDPITVHFSVPQGNGQRHFRVQARVARVMDGGSAIGVFMPEGMEQRAYETLNDFAGVARPAGRQSGDPADGLPADARDPRVSEADAKRVKAQLKEMVDRALPRIARAFMERADKDLLVRARDAGSTTLQNLLFESMAELERSRRSIEEALVRRIAAQIEVVEDPEMVIARRRQQSFAGQSDKLSLVDTARFEEWLASAEVISKAEARSTHQLTDIRLRMGLLARGWSHKEVNPVSPAAIISALDACLEPVNLPKGTRKVLYKSMQEAVLPLLRNLYSSIDDWLAGCGAFPPLDDIQEKPAPRPPKPRPVQRPAAAGEPVADAQGMAPGAAGASAGQGVAGSAGVGMAPGGFASLGGLVQPGLIQPGQLQPGPLMRGAPQSGVAMAAGEPGATFAGMAGTNPDLAQGIGMRGAGVASGGWSVGAYQAVRELLDLDRQARVARGASAMPEAPTGGSEFSSLEVLAGLSDLQRGGVVASRPLRMQLAERLRHSSGDSRRGLAATDVDRLQVIENLVASVQQDDLITEGVKQWVKQMELTLSKLATVEPEFLNSSPHQPHSAMAVLDQLAKLGNTGDESEGIDREVGRRVDELMQRVVNDFDNDPGVFDEVLKNLHPLVEKQTRAYRGNFERTVRQSEGQQKLVNARRAVLDVLTRRVAEREVPNLFLELLTPGWRNLMVHAYLRHGPESAEWRRNLEVADRIVTALTGDRPASAAEARELVNVVRAGLESISFEPSKREPLLARLADALASGNVRELERKRVRRADVAGVLELESVLPQADPEPVGEDDESRAQWRRALAQARKLQVGDWLAYTDNAGRPRILTLAFVGESHSSFVLVNRKGIKVREFALREMADAMQRGIVTLLDEFDLPLTERATHRMLQNMHNQLAYQASHDELTGLINRREFERKLEALLATAKSDDFQHVLLYLDLDQFKVINSTSGHSAGDELLKQVSARMKHALRGSRNTLARLGGDEFAVLLDRTSADEGRAIAERLLEALRELKFEVEGRLYSTTASIGVVQFDSSAETATGVLRQADSACFAAKDAGRARLHFYERDDEQMRARHGAMEWAVQIDKAIAEERLQLNYQPITPVRRDEGSEEHFELLLTMIDEQGNTVAPADFIAAAETYNRMGPVDRWVVKAALEWMGEHRAELERIGGFSINISGQSINDESFADYVLRQFSLTRVPTGKVCFEVTETAAIGNINSAIGFMNKMKLIGCRFSLDDFGTGLSSYSYLRNLPVDYIKIDGVFVRDLPNNPGDYAVVKSINEIAHFMGKLTVAEYVENDAILAQLREIGVDYAQGYGIGRPKPLKDFVLPASIEPA